VHAQGMTLDVTEAAKKLLVAHGHQPEFGARPLRRTIQAELDNRIASILLSGDAEPGDAIVADVENDTIHCTVRKGEAAEEAKAEGSAEEPPAAGAQQTPDA
jgi:ATP-dependent Clp protease ATP-binding subunit ClpC